MRFISLFFTLVSMVTYGCGQPSQNNQHVTFNKMQDTTIVKYDESSITKDFSSEGINYSVTLSTINVVNKVVVYSNQRFSDREIVLLIKGDSGVNYEKRIKKEIFFKQSEGINISQYLIYKTSFSNTYDPLILFSIEVNLCMPETDDCYFFKLDFKNDGNYTIKRVDVEDEGVE